ncbi:hypothetical protein evm_009188 [Chilo suppressalis]|nr:hypothetical protein evm_009188 [Chilo suppressalis]
MNDDVVIIALLESLERINEDKIITKQLRDNSNPFLLPESKFKKIFRLPRDCARYLIEALDCEELQMGSLPKQLKVLCALHFFAQGSYQASLGQDYNLALSQPSVSRCLDTVANLIIRKLTPSKIIFPNTPAERAENKAEFLSIFGMPNTIGAVDGSHIGIIAPPLSHPTAPGNIFYNRKGFYSINCQVICNAKGRIINVNPNFPGSTHDAAVWRASNVNKSLERAYIQGNENEWLLGDKGYPLLPWLMTPLSAPATAAEQQYNNCHKQARNIIEKTFGKLKNRFRCLLKHRILHYSPEKSAKIIVSCCTLYNLFFDTYSADEDDEITDEEEHINSDEMMDPDHGNDFLTAARVIQNQLIRSHFSV